ncbi:MAG: hypothetical protein ACYTFA_15140 [Planctomycetota bacterium]|jgi:hypothetical protein
MELIVTLVVGSIGEWVVLLIVIPFAQRLADFSMPPALEMARKLFVIVLLKNIIGVGVTMILGGFPGKIAAAIVLWTGLVKVFDLDFFGAVMIVVVSFVLQVFVMGALFALVLGGYG